jgi:hypothetical protein
MHVKDVIDYQECACSLQGLFPGKEPDEIAQAISNYFHAGSTWDEDLVYSQAQAEDFIQNLLAEFVAEQTNCTKFDAKTAIDLQMPISSSVSSIYAEGGWL